jgi:hypothetical protein
MTKYRRMSWAQHVARMKEKHICRGNLKEKNNLETRCRWEDNINMDPTYMVMHGLDSSGSVQGQVARSFEHSNEHFIKISEI